MSIHCLWRVVIFNVCWLAVWVPCAIADWETVPVELNRRGDMEVAVILNGKNARFLLDTGSSTSVVDQRVLSEYRILVSPENVAGYGFGNAKDSRLNSMVVRINHYQLGSKEIPLRRLYSHNLTHSVEQGVAGIMGQDALNRIHALLDVADLKILIPEARTSSTKLNEQFQQNGYNFLSMGFHDFGFYFIDALVDASPVRLIVDTGAPRIVVDENEVIQMGMTPVPHPSASSISPSGEPVPLKRVEKVHVRLGDVIFDGDIIVTDLSGLLSVLNKTAKTRFIGVVGREELTRLHAVIDFRDARMWMKR